MKELTVQTARPYPVTIGGGTLALAGQRLSDAGKTGRVMIVTASNVAPLYLETVRASLTAAGFACFAHVLPAGEASKNGTELLALLEAAAGCGMRRSDTFAALGGGVVGDLCGFAAAVYMRGTDFLMLPTTLLAAVDSSVGGKTAIDLQNGKNLAGAFHQPIAVLCDPDTLATLPPRQFANGMAEVIKYGMIRDPELLALLEQGADGRLEEIIFRCVSLKADIVSRDEFDTGERQLLNFGHTLGHAIEKESGFSVDHGAAVAMGMKLITAGCAALGRCESSVFRRLNALLAQYGLGGLPPTDPEALVRAAQNDKKYQGDRITLVLPEAYGRCALVLSETDELARLAREGSLAG